MLTATDDGWWYQGGGGEWNEDWGDSVTTAATAATTKTSLVVIAFFMLIALVMIVHAAVSARWQLQRHAALLRAHTSLPTATLRELHIANFELAQLFSKHRRDAVLLHGDKLYASVRRRGSQQNDHGDRDQNTTTATTTDSHYYIVDVDSLP